MDSPSTNLPYGLKIHIHDPQVKTRPIKCGPLIGVAFDLPYSLPGQKCSLIYLPWPENVPKPVFNPSAQYNDVFVHGKERTQPRKTLCYGVSYRYSGRSHKLEDVTPLDITRLMDYTRHLYDPKEELPVQMMCLANWYPTKYHYISSHSDKEGQSSNLRDIWCWSVGQSRKIIIRTREGILGEGSKKKMILKITIPEGIYVMQGYTFQQTYEHEIPREKLSLFNKLSPLVPQNITGGLLKSEKQSDQQKGEKQSDLRKADWLAANEKEVAEKFPNLYQDYLDWRVPRYSYTIRFFAK